MDYFFKVNGLLFPPHNHIKIWVTITPMGKYLLDS